MSTTIDHVFICCSEGAPEGDALVRLGLKEGTPNTHPGQGTACRRFFFSNAYLELGWVSDPLEAQAEDALPTRVWERWSKRAHGACPYGIVLRPADIAAGGPAPFDSWQYMPRFMPRGFVIDIARGTPLSGPELFYFGFQRGRARTNEEPIDHDLPVRLLTGVTVWRPVSGGSKAASSLAAAGVLACRDADEYLLELQFDDGIGAGADLRPALPLALQW